MYTPCGVAAQAAHSTISGLAAAHALLRRLLGLGLSRGRRGQRAARVRAVRGEPVSVAVTAAARKRRRASRRRRCAHRACTRARCATAASQPRDEFRYPLFMAYLDLDELPQLFDAQSAVVGAPPGARVVSPRRPPRRSARRRCARRSRETGRASSTGIALDGPDPLAHAPALLRVIASTRSASTTASTPPASACGRSSRT